MGTNSANRCKLPVAAFAPSPLACQHHVWRRSPALPSLTSAPPSPEKTPKPNGPSLQPQMNARADLAAFLQLSNMSLMSDPLDFRPEPLFHVLSNIQTFISTSKGI